MKINDNYEFFLNKTSQSSLACKWYDACRHDVFLMHAMMRMNCVVLVKHPPFGLRRHQIHL
jgi:hypothetical protein